MSGAKIQEYLLRAFLAAVLSALIAGPLVGVVVVLATGVHGSKHFQVGIGVLTAIVIFYLPANRDSSKEWVEKWAADERRRKQHEIEQAEWIKQERERIASRRKTTD
jgi:LytS/YehU family sensor histidine kinase